MKYNIKLDYNRDNLIDVVGRKRLKDSYMMSNELSPQERFAFVSSEFASNSEHAQRLYEYSSRHWLSYSTPILSFGRNKRGLPVSCYLNYLEDTSEGLVNTLSETNWLSMLGGGVGVHFRIRQQGANSTGVMQHLKTYEVCSAAYKQGSTRRGSYAAFLDINHPEIMQFLEMRKATGDQNLKSPHLNHGVNITDRFMQLIEECTNNPEKDDSWELIDPSNGKVTEIVSAKKLWEALLEIRMQTGEPYLWFIDRANEGLPEYQKLAGLKNHGSNICVEVSLATSKERTAVCCLSSVNLEYFDEWKDNSIFIHDVIEMLDNALQYFIDNAPDAISRARYSAYRERSVGLGALGFHAYLQKNNISFESALAKSCNIQIFKHIRKYADLANETLTKERGSCPDAEEYGVNKRLSHVLAVAPNATSSLIMQNTSPSIEPYSANVYRQDTSSGAFIIKNRFLDSILKSKSTTLGNKWYEDTWSSIIANDGSVQHLEELSIIEKEVFKTAMEIDQRWIIEHSADRQKYIDQSISTNIFLSPKTDIKYLHAIHFLAWKKGLKSLYYLRSSKLRSADKVGMKILREKLEKIPLEKMTQDDCLACE